MPVAVLEPDVVVKPNTDEDPYLFDVDEDDDLEYEEFLQAIFDIEEIIHFLEEDKVKSVDSIKGSLLNIDVIYNYFRKCFPNSEIVSKMKVFLSQEGEKILQLINERASNELVLQELKKLLSYVVDAYKRESNPNQKDDDLDPAHSYDDPSLDIHELMYSKVDSLYEKLYEAIEKNDVRKETCYRGRIIRELSKHRDEIHNEYEKVKVLPELGKIIASKSPDALSQIQTILSQPENKKYYDYFYNSLHSLEEFQSKLFLLLQNSSIMKIVFYEYALKEEKKTQGKKLKDRYSKEFLDKRAGVTSIATVLPNAVGLSVQKLANTIKELQEAKTSRKKVSKFLETLKDSGRVLATPVIYLGKFAINNWYVLYKLYGSYQAVKPTAIPNETKVDEKTDKEEELAKEAESPQTGIQTNPDVKEDPVVEPDQQPDPVPEPEQEPIPDPEPEPDSIVDPEEEITDHSTSSHPGLVPKPHDIMLHPERNPGIQDSLNPNKEVHFDDDPDARVVHHPDLDAEIDAAYDAYTHPDTQGNPAVSVDSDPVVEPAPAPEPQPDPAPEPDPDPGQPLIEIDPEPSVGVDSTIPYDPWRWEAVCDPRSESFIVLPGFLIDWLGLRETVDTMNDMAIYHNYPYSNGGGTTITEHGSSHASGKF